MYYLGGFRFASPTLHGIFEMASSNTPDHSQTRRRKFATPVLCGWLGQPQAKAHRQRAVVEIGRRMAPDGEHGYRVHAGPRSVLLISAAPAADLHVGETCYTAIVGHPSWTDARLATLARERGAAHALAAAYLDDGMRAFEYARGDFAAAIIDEAKSQAILAIDRIGIRPMTYAVAPDGLVFGSSLNLLHQLSGVSPDIDPQAIFEYLYFDMVPSPNTIYRAERKLEPAQWVRFADEQLTTAYYWTPRFTESDRSAFDPHDGVLYRLLERAVQDCEPGATTGAFLSGGLDSSTVCGVLSRVATSQVASYSIGFRAEGYDEMSYARIAARHFALDSHEYYITPADVVSAIPLIAQSYDEPFGNSSAVPVYYCARLAQQQGIEVMLAGDGGDELFAGNERYAKQKMFELYSRIPAGLRSWFIEPIALRLPGAETIAPLRKLGSYVRQANIPLPDRLQSYNWLRINSLADILHDDFLKTIDPGSPTRLLAAPYARPASASPLNRMLHLDWRLTLADNDLRKVNAMCEVAGVEVKYPMLHPDLIEHSLAIPTDQKLKGFRLRHYYKEALDNFLPRAIIDKRKHGFGLPFGIWLRESPALQELIYDALADFGRRQIVRSEYIRMMLDRHRLEHAAFYGSTLWTLTILEQWFQAHGRSRPPTLA
jgi:asparagine synthase (glutamine-hydrolysing)